MSAAALRPDRAHDLRRRLADPRRLVEMLGLQEGARAQHHGLLVRCPAHEDRTPSCSVRVAGDGTIACRCFACDWSADALGLVAVAHGLDVRRDFVRVLDLAGQLAGSEPLPSRQAPPPPREYPPRAEVAALWDASVPVVDDAEVMAWLRDRGVNPGAVGRDLARALPRSRSAPLPRWARSHLGAWPAAGYACVVPLFDETGTLRSVRARRVVARDDGGPKALPPAGHRTSGLVMACGAGRRMLAGAPQSARVLVVEGEPDFLLAATRPAGAAVLGIISGAWSPAIGARIPTGARVSIRTHADMAGDRYAQQVAETLRGRCSLFRGAP